MAAIKNDVAIYAIHTNLDNVHTGVNRKISELLELSNTRVLVPKNETLGKLTTFIPSDKTEEVLSAIHEAAAQGLSAIMIPVAFGWLVQAHSGPMNQLIPISVRQMNWKKWKKTA
jgi:putative NIF3 family GTP cyclohydrolase 1 type 2